MKVMAGRRKKARRGVGEGEEGGVMAIRWVRGAWAEGIKKEGKMETINQSVTSMGAFSE